MAARKAAKPKWAKPFDANGIVVNDDPFRASLDPRAFADERRRLSELCVTEQNARKAARAANAKTMPATPYIEELQRRQATMTTTKKQTTNKHGDAATGTGPKVRLDDAALRDKVRELIGEGYVTTASCVLRLREIGLGSNDRRVRAAFDDVAAAPAVRKQIDAVLATKATPKPAPKAATTKAAPAKKANGKPMTQGQKAMAEGKAARAAKATKAPAKKAAQKTSAKKTAAA